LAEPSPGEIIGRNVRTVRDAKLFSRPDLAKRSGVSLAGIDHLERGLSARPRRRTIEKLAEALDVDVDTLMEGAEFPLGQALALQDRLFDGASEREAFIERVREYIEARVAHYEMRLTQAEEHRVLPDYESAGLLLDDAIEEFIHLPDLVNGELAERWMLDPEVPETVKEDLGRAVGEVLQPLVDVVGRISEKARAKSRLELVHDQDRAPRLRRIA
jgi:transcriptional regulator with XRE-family HTH domain